MTEYKQVLSNLLRRIKNVRRKESALFFAGRFVLSCALACLVILAVSAVEMIARGDEVFRTVLALLAFVGFHAVMMVYLVPAIRCAFIPKYKQPEKQVALRIGEVFPEIKDRLCNAVQLAVGGVGKKGIS